MSHRSATLYSRGKARTSLFMLLDRHQPRHAAQSVPTRSHRSHGRLYQRVNQATHYGSAPPRRRLPSQGRKVDQGMVTSPTDGQCVILAASATNVTSIPTSPPPTLHRFLNVRNATALQADCALTYAGDILYLSTSFCQDLLQGHLLAIPDPDAPARLSPLLTPPPSAGPANSQQQEMRIQVPL